MLERYRAYIVPKDRSILKDPSRSQKLSDDISAWLKDQVAHYKLLRGGKHQDCPMKFVAKPDVSL